jgi:SAM-dependent methyltransferase
MTSDPAMNEAYDRWADYYDIGEGDREPFLRFYASLLRPGDRSVLDIGCGTGVIAADLAGRIAQAGHAPRVVGLDVSSAMLEIARTRHPGLEWVHGDMRDLPVQGRFDLITCCFNSLQFMRSDAELAQAFRAAREHVAEGGRYAFDLYQPNLPYLRVARADSLGRKLIHAGDALEIREDASYDEASRVLDLHWRLVRADARDRLLAATRFRLRQFLAEDVERQLAATGWRIEQRFGGLDRSDFTAGSTKQVLVCVPA